MTDHPITPPPELMDKWVAMLEYCEDIDVFTDVARWGADQELEACCEWFLKDGWNSQHPANLRADRRPKSVKQKGLEALEKLELQKTDSQLYQEIRDAINTIPD